MWHRMGCKIDSTICRQGKWAYNFGRNIGVAKPKLHTNPHITNRFRSHTHRTLGNELDSVANKACSWR